MVVNVIFTITIVSLAAGAVAKLQFRIGNIGTAADGTLVGVRGLLLGMTSLIGAGVGEGDGFCFLTGRSFAEQPPGVHPPGHGHYVEHVFPEKQEVIGKGDNGKKIRRERIEQKSQNYEYQIQKRKYPGFNRDDEQEQKLCVRIHGRITQKQA